MCVSGCPGGEVRRIGKKGGPSGLRIGEGGRKQGGLSLQAEGLD